MTEPERYAIRINYNGKSFLLERGRNSVRIFDNRPEAEQFAKRRNRIAAEKGIEMAHSAERIQ